MSAWQAMLVDLDGTLADTAEPNFTAYAQALREVGVEVGREDFHRIAFGRTWREFLPTLLSQAGVNVDAAAVAMRKADVYAQLLGTLRFNEALVMLLQHRPPTVKAALVTTASAGNVSAVLGQRPALAALFDVVVSGDDVQRHKPDPEAYQMAAARLGVDPAGCIVFEDSDIGVAAASAFGAQVLRIRF